MRQALLKKLTELAQHDQPVYVLTADTGFHVFDTFQEEFPDRYLNVGISEAAMIGAAAGLALCGRRPFVYGIVPFVTMRCFEQIRVDLCYQNLPVKVVGVGGGLIYGPAGATHHSIEDIAAMSCLPNMTVICPGDPVETEAAVAASMLLEGPCYFRLGKSGDKVIHEHGVDSFEIGKGIRLRQGRDLALISTGNMLETASLVHELLGTRGVESGLVSMHTVKPIDRELVAELAGTCRTIATIEEHSVIGGLGSAVAGILAELGSGARLLRFGIPDEYAPEAGSQEHLRELYGLTPHKIFGAILASTT